MPSRISESEGQDGTPCSTGGNRATSSAKDVLPASEFIPSHHLGVKPLGNQYLSSTPSARRNIGSLQALPDEMLMLALECLDRMSLHYLASTCKFFYALCESEDLWKSVFLQQQNQPVDWRGSWRSTVLRVPSDYLPDIDCGNVFSDVIHRPFACANISLRPYAERIPKRNQIRRFDNLTYDEFAGQWTEKPFILTECIKDWPVLKHWTINSLLEDYAKVEFRAEAVDWTLATYCRYMSNNRDESPLYLFDRGFAEKMKLEIGHTPGAAYWRPECFGPDLFEVLGNERPAHRWLIIGPKRSGSTFHKDPNGTSAWNAVIQGSKYWIMFPPSTQVPGVYVSHDSSEVTSPLSIAEWLLTFHEEARQLPECVEGVCHAGEILHVPSGWWHLVVNLEEGIALTQNFVPQSPSLTLVSHVLSFLKDKADQVSGFRDDIKDPYALFSERLREAKPDVLEKALQMLEERGQKKRKWDEVVVNKEEDGGGFSFGFGGDDDDDIP